MWLVTHSDALLREALTTPRATVLHMQEAARHEFGKNQLKRVEENRDEEHAVMEMVGDIAAYRPQAKMVIFEGKNSGFDIKMTSRLFPEYEKKMNFIAGGNKAGVERLHKWLEGDARQGVGRIYSIVDGDSDGATRIGRRRFSWDVYHIENYLLESTYIAEVIKDLSLEDGGTRRPGAIEEELREVARGHVSKLVKEHVTQYVNRALVTKIEVEAREVENMGKDLWSQAQDSLSRIKLALEEELTEETIEEQRSVRVRELVESLGTDEWKKVFRGRDILKGFTVQGAFGLPYERLRDMIVNRMQQREYQPPGMLSLLRRIDRCD